MDTLKSRMEAYEKTLAAWLATQRDGNLETDSSEYDSFEAAEFEVIEWQCASLGEAQEKVQFFRRWRELRDTVANDRTYLSLFLDSLVIPTLADLISRYGEAKRVWEAQFDKDCDGANNSPEWRAYMDASCAIIDYRCADMVEIKARATFMLSDDNLVDMLANCATEVAARDFLSSMAAPVDKSNSGDN